jgi:hypothetical protein
MKNNKELEQIYQEGLLKAQLSGHAGRAKAVMGNLGRAGIGIFKGGNVQQQDVGAAANQSKLDSIIKSFKNDLQTLFGRDWETKYASLANELTTLQTPANKKQPLKVGQIVTGVGIHKGKYRVDAPELKGKVRVTRLQKNGKPFGAPIPQPLNRKTDIKESKKTTIDEAYKALTEVKKL